MNNKAAPAPALIDPPAPAWLLARVLQPGEKVAWSRGPATGPWREWALKRYPWLGIVLELGPLPLPLIGAGIAFLCGIDWMTGARLAVPVVLGSFFLAFLSWIEGARHLCHALTDRRLLRIKGLHYLEQLDVEVLRRALAPGGPAAPADEHLLDVSKVRPLLPPPKEGVTDVEPLLHLLRAFGQVQAPPKP
jgi:hypothetical protein